MPTTNCWKLERADRITCLIDADAYFRTLYDVIGRARRSIYVVGWDIDSRTRLIGQGSDDDEGRLAEVLSGAASRRPELQVRVLCWDFSPIYALEREPLPKTKLGWRTHERVHFALDGVVSVGGSVHHKIVVIDEKVAFVGGIDICDRRWDTPEHRSDDCRRIDLRGRQYLPHHDLQIAVDGSAARAVAEVVRERWEVATGERLAPRTAPGDPWPPDLPTDFERTSVALARTVPATEKTASISEVQQLYLDCIAAAKRWIYIENPYPTSRVLAEALAGRLNGPDPPEVIIVGPRECSGWLEEATMGVLRGRFVDRLHRADRSGRLGIYSAVTSAGDGEMVSIKVHSKCMIVDDCLLRVGSANMSGRSMGLDVELDVLLEAESSATRRSIADLRCRLMAEHLGTTPIQVRRAVESEGSLLDAIETLRSAGRTLLPDLEGWMSAADQPLPDESLIDPEESVVSVEGDTFVRRVPGVTGWKVAALVVLVLGAAALTLAGVGDTIDVEGWVRGMSAWKGSWFAPLVLAGGFVVAGLVLVPVTLMIAMSGLMFGPGLGAVYGLGAALTSAAAYFGLGRWLGHNWVRRAAGSRLERLSRLLARRGLFAVAAIRTFPVAPHLVVGLLGGASHVSFRDYMLGTLIAMAPGTVVLAALGHHLGTSVRDPTIENLAGLVLMGAAILVVAWFMQRWLGRYQPVLSKEEEPSKDVR